MSGVSAGETEVREKQEEVIGSGEVGAVEIKGRAWGKDRVLLRVP